VNMRKKPIKLVASGLPLFVALSLCCTAVAWAEVSVTDNWDQSGKVSVTTGHMIVEFSQGDAGVTVYSRSGQTTKKSMQVVPFRSRDVKARGIVRCKVIKSTAKQVEIAASFSAGQRTIDGTFLFDEAGTIHVKPAQDFNGISVGSPIEYAVLPSRIVDDVIYEPAKYPDADQLHLPAENLVMGLLDGRDRILACAIPPGKQQVRLLLEDGKPEERDFRAVEIELDQKSVYLTILSAPGIWHRQELLPSFLEKDVEIPWQKPFQARWKTHLLEGGNVETAYAFKSGKQDFWRAGLGSSVYPVWFEGDKAFMRLSKKFPPVGHVFIYPLEDHPDTPIAFATRCLGDVPSLAKKIKIDRPDSVVGCESCDGHDYMTRIFRVGMQYRERKFLREGLDDFMGVTGSYARRLVQYHNFVEDMKARVKSWYENATPELRPFLGKIKHDMRELAEEFSRRMGGMTAPQHLQYQTEAIDELRVLVGEKGLEVYPRAAFLIEENHLFISRFEGIPAKVGGQARELARRVAHNCTFSAAAAEYAKKIRKEIRELLGKGAKFESIY